MSVQTLTFNGYPGKSKDRSFPIPGFKGLWKPGETRQITDDYCRVNGWSIPPADVVTFVTTVLNNGMPKGQEPFTKGTATADDVRKTEAEVMKIVKAQGKRLAAPASEPDSEKE